VIGKLIQPGWVLIMPNDATGLERVKEVPATPADRGPVPTDGTEASQDGSAGDTELRTTGWCRPPHNIEFFLGALFASTKENSGRPGLFDAAFLMTRYRREYAMLEMPTAVRRVVMPLLYGVGRVLGKYDKYTSAPAPIVARRE